MAGIAHLEEPTPEAGLLNMITLQVQYQVDMMNEVRRSESLQRVNLILLGMGR